MANQFFYDGQIRRFLYQFIRIMSHYQVEFGKDSAGNTALQTVPVYYGDSSRMAAQIIRGNSENALPTVPAMACYISGLEYDRPRLQEPYHVSKANVRERSYDSTTDTWGHDQGGAFTVERLMPAPYKLTLKTDIWTSNTQQKMQLWEQIAPLFNPSMEIQSTDNVIDWTTLTYITLTGTNWSSRTVPVGAEDQIDIATLTFEMPIWISLPVRVKKLGVIQKIIASLYDAQGDVSADILDLPSAQLLARRVITPMNYGVVYFGNTLQLFRPNDVVTDTIDGPVVHNHTPDTYSWKTLVDLYGLHLVNGTSEIRLDQPNGSTLVGTVSYHPTDASLLLFNPYSDTVPSNTLAPVNAIIDPFNVDVDSTYVHAAAGTRYMILNDIGSQDNIESAQAWHGNDGSDLVAQANDIIEYNGTRWFVAFAAGGQPDVKYVTNLKTGLQFKWTPETQSWSKSTEGTYGPGDWTLVLTTLV